MTHSKQDIQVEVKGQCCHHKPNLEDARNGFSSSSPECSCANSWTSVKLVWSTESPEVQENKSQMFKASRFLEVVAAAVITHTTARQDWTGAGVKVKRISTLDNGQME